MRMEMVGEVVGSQDKVWHRCTRCHHISLIEIIELASGKSKEGIDVGTATLYNPQQSFKVGEAIFHSDLNDVGKVVNKIKTSDGSQAIVVSFEKEGERRLLENVKPELIPNVPS